MGALGQGANADQLRIEADDRSSIGAFGEAEDSLADRDPVLDDPVDRASDELLGALRTISGRDRNDRSVEPRTLAPPQSLDACAADRDLAE